MSAHLKGITSRSLRLQTWHLTGKDARRGRCHPLETAFWALWMTPLPRNYAAQAQAHASRAGGWGTPLTEMEDRRATVTDALQSTTFRLYSSAAAPVTGEAAPRHPLPRCQGTKCRPGSIQFGV